jgi:hypothetical protein
MFNKQVSYLTVCPVELQSDLVVDNRIYVIFDVFGNISLRNFVFLFEDDSNRLTILAFYKNMVVVCKSIAGGVNSFHIIYRAINNYVRVVGINDADESRNCFHNSSIHTYKIDKNFLSPII